MSGPTISFRSVLHDAPRASRLPADHAVEAQAPDTQNLLKELARALARQAAREAFAAAATPGEGVRS